MPAPVLSASSSLSLSLSVLVRFVTRSSQVSAADMATRTAVTRRRTASDMMIPSLGMRRVTTFDLAQPQHGLRTQQPHALSFRTSKRQNMQPVGFKKIVLVLSSPRVGPGRTWGGAGQNHPPFVASILRPHILTYIWRWPRCLGRCYWVLPLPCSSLRPCRALPGPFLRLSGPCLTLIPK